MFSKFCEDGSVYFLLDLIGRLPAGRDRRRWLELLRSVGALATPDRADSGDGEGFQARSGWTRGDDIRILEERTLGVAEPLSACG